MALSEGDTLGPYQILGQFGQGGMATVYKAYHPALERFVAIKMIHAGYMDDPGFRARFQREARIIARLEHPHIVPVYDYNEHEGQPYLVMKLIEGRTLRAEMAEGGLLFDQLIGMLSTIAGALTYAHEQGVLHRDIKPSNILVDNIQRPYLTDFGLARLAQSGSTTLSQDMLLGTPHYISPEQGKGNEQLTPAADIYSLGVILYELAVGRVPFSGNTPYSIVHDHIYTPLPLPTALNPKISPAVEQVLMTALAKDPNDRYSSAVEMMKAFREAQSHSPLPDVKTVSAPTPLPQRTEAMPPPPTAAANIPAPVKPTAPPRTQTDRPARPEQKGRNPAVAVLGLIAVLTLAVILVISLLQSSQPETPLPTLASIGTTLNTAQPIADSSSGISFYDVPVIPVDEAQAAVRQNPNDPAAYLTLARALWAVNRPQEAQQAIADGLGVVDDLVKYLLTAGKISDEDGNVTAAVFLYAEALNCAQANPERYPAVRNYVGEYVYGVALAPEGFNAAELARLKNSAGAGSNTQSTLLDIMAARILITEDRLRLAETALRRLPTEAASLPETALVRGELLAAQGNMERAQAEWQALMTAPDSPEWVLARATELLNAANSGA